MPWPAAEFLDTPVEFIGSARGDVVRPGTDFTAYWYDNLRNTVRFDRAAAAASQRGVGAFVEMSAHPALVYALTDQIGGALIVGSGQRDEPVVEQLSANIAAAAVANPGYRWIDVVDAAGAVSTFKGPTLPGFPNAPMREIHLWATPEPLRDEPAGSALTIAVEEWESRDSPATETRCSMAIVAPADGLGGKSDSLARQLAAAIAKHRACDLVPPGEADIVVLIAPTVQDSDLTVAADKIVNRAAPDYAKNVGPRCRRAWLITAGAECVASEQRSPAQAALGAMHRSVGFEFPDCRFAHLDLPDWDLDADDALACVDALLDESDADLALRAGSSGLRRHVRALRESAQLPPQLDAGTLDNVVITGGNGAIGMRYARYCVQRGARRIVLLSRTGVDREVLNEILSGRDVEVHAPTCDITDPEALSAVAAEYAGDGASLLIHTAGAATFAPRDQLSDADLTNMLQAKVVGLARMVEVWPLRLDLRILLCSSVSAVWGGHGHAGYSAANRMLDVLAGQLRADGFGCTAVRWGLWQGTGITGADEIARIARSGLVAMDPDAAIAASLRHHAGDT